LYKDENSRKNILPGLWFNPPDKTEGNKKIIYA
jgi:hypothetical protein